MATNDNGVQLNAQCEVTHMLDNSNYLHYQHPQNNIMQPMQSIAKNSKECINEWTAKYRTQKIQKAQNKVNERMELFVEYVAEHFEEKVSDIAINCMRRDTYNVIATEMNKWEGVPMAAAANITEKQYKKKAFDKFRWLRSKWDDVFFVAIIRYVNKNFNDAAKHIGFGKTIMNARVKLHYCQGTKQPFIPPSTLGYKKGDLFRRQLELLFHGTLAVSQLYQQEKNKLTPKNRHFPNQKYRNMLLLAINNIPMTPYASHALAPVQNPYYTNQRNQSMNTNNVNPSNQRQYCENYVNQNCIVCSKQNNNNWQHSYEPVHSQTYFVEQSRQSPTFSVNNGIESFSPMLPSISPPYPDPLPFCFL